MPIPIVPIDHRLFHLLYARQNPWLESAAVGFSALGSGWSLLAIAPFAAQKRTQRFAAWLIGSLIGTAALVAAVKVAVGRGRPFTVYPPLAKALIDSPTDHSFPSGHAAGSFCFAMFVTNALLSQKDPPRWAKAASAASIVFASCVGVSRVVLGFHFPADVVAGAVLGGAIGGASGRFFVRGSAA